jgi:putative heme-binding domain-containing protein
MNPDSRALIGLLILLGGLFHASAAGLLQRGDVVALAGGANLERTRFHGQLHAQLVAAAPALELRFRNLAWEGDTIFEQWRDTGKEQWRLSRDWKQQLADAGATVVLAQFGQMESLGGATRLDEFVAAYEKLLDDFAAGGRRVVLVSPVPFEKTSSPTLPDLSSRNDDARRYTDAIRALAQRRKLAFVDLFTPLAWRPLSRPSGTLSPARSGGEGRGEGALTDNGFHLNARGHEVVALEVTRQLGLKPAPALPPALRDAVVEFERLWFDFWRPMNWAFLSGDRTHVQFSRDWRDNDKRLFPEEMREFEPLLRIAEENIRRALAGRPALPLTVERVVPTEPPPTPPQTPAEELATLQVHADYALNLFASEADGVVKPLQIRWDERGRLWVLCPVSYPQVRPGEKANDRIVICEDSNGDGRADNFTTFADGLFMPTGLELGDGGAYVTQGTDLWHLRDTNGDGKADARRLVLGGFGTGDTHQMVNCLSWGFGGELWFTQGHHIWSRVETPYGVEHLNRSGVWRLRPRTLRMDPFFQMSSAGHNCWGVLTDDFGQVFHKTGADIGGFYSVPGLIRTDLALPSEVLRLFQARVKQVGFDFIGTRHFPDDLQGTVAVGGFYDNTLQHHRLEYRDGVFTTRQLPNLVETTNKVFRPVDVRVGPDGAIYFADWYNPIIGHYQTSYRHPDRDKDHGRVWRLQRKDRAPVKPAWLAGAKTEALLEQLDSPERWAQYQAKRLLFERDTKEVVAALNRWVKPLKAGDTRDEYRRLQALSVFEAHETPRPELLKSLLRSPDFRVRAYATRALANWARDGALPGALKLLEAQATDEHPRVRLEAVVAASYLADPATITLATRVLDQPMDKYLDYALTKCVDALRPQWSGPLAAGKLSFARDEHLLHLLKGGGVTNADTMIRARLAKLPDTDPAARLWLGALASVGNAADLRLVFDRARADAALLDTLVTEATARKLAPAGDVAADLRGMLDAPDEASRLRAVQLAGAWKVGALASRVEALAVNKATPATLRAGALGALADLRARAAVPQLAAVAGSPDDAPAALAALEALLRVSPPDAARVAVKRVAGCASATEAAYWLRPFTRRIGSAGPLTKALTENPLPAPQARHALSALSSASRYERPLIEKLTEQAGFSPELPVFTPEFVRELVAEARARGNAAEGRNHYAALACAACHTINGEGGKAGPDLSALGRGLPADMIVTELIWPQLNVKEGFEALSVTTKDGRLVEGIKQSETGDEIAIRDTLTGEITRVRRAQVAQIKPTGSVMPEGLIAPLTRQQLADLVRYLMELGN